MLKNIILMAIICNAEYIRMPKLPSSTSKNYDIYWNVPTSICQRYKIYFHEVSDNYGIIRNLNDTFRGNKIAIMYRPGMFPYVHKSKNINERDTVINGGVPQEGNLTKHLELLKTDIETQIDNNFTGIGVIDFEEWRPIYRQNWASLLHYRNYSIAIEKRLHPNFKNKTLRRSAVRRFQAAGQLFMEETIKTAKQLRPNAAWGYYGYPECINLSPGSPQSDCGDRLRTDNDGMSWLWAQSDILLPSIYLRHSLSSTGKIAFINGRLSEAERIADKYNNRHKIYPYFWYKYDDTERSFLTREVMQSTFEEVFQHNVDGLIIWGSSSDVDTKEKCEIFKNYLNTILGPTLLNAKNM